MTTPGTQQLSKMAIKRLKLQNAINDFQSLVNRKNIDEAIGVIEWAKDMFSMNIQEKNNRKNSIAYTQTIKGQVYEANMGKGIGNEQSNTRPIVIIEEDTIQEIFSTVTVVPLTSALRKNGTPKPVLDCRTRFQSANLGGDSLAKCDQIVTISKTRLGQLKCQLENEHIKSIDEAIARHVKFKHKIQKSD